MNNADCEKRDAGSEADEADRNEQAMLRAKANEALVTAIAGEQQVQINKASQMQNGTSENVQEQAET